MVRELARRGVIKVHPTWTTRPRRPDEANGSVEHEFVSEAEFDRLDAAGFFADRVAMFGLPYRYGLPPLRRSPDGPVDAVMLRAPLVDRFAAICDDFTVFQIEDTPTRAAERLRARGTSEDDIAARLADNNRELVAGRAIAARVFVNDGTLDELADVIAAALTEASVAA